MILLETMDVIFFVVVGDEILRLVLHLQPVVAQGIWADVIYTSNDT